MRKVFQAEKNNEKIKEICRQAWVKLITHFDKGKWENRLILFILFIDDISFEKLKYLFFRAKFKI